MPQPAVQNDLIQGQCMPGTHQVPSPSGGPMANPAPLPFLAPLQSGLISTVTIGGRPVAVVGSSGNNQPAHIGLHASDPTQADPTRQVGRVTSGSATVTFGGKQAATTASQCSICGGVATIKATVMNVTIG